MDRDRRIAAEIMSVIADFDRYPERTVPIKRADVVEAGAHGRACKATSNWTEVLIVTLAEPTPVLEAAELQADPARAGSTRGA